MSSFNDSPTMALICRSDIQLSKGKLASQCAHAAVKCAIQAKTSARRLLERWQKGGARKIVLEVDNLSLLKSLFNKAKSCSIIAEFVEDAGHTEIPKGTVTVLGLGPAPRRTIDDICSELKLVR